MMYRILLRHKGPRSAPWIWHRSFSKSSRRQEIRDLTHLPDRVTPRYLESHQSDLLSLQWPSPPRNILFVKKDGVQEVTESMVQYAKYIHRNYENISLIFEPHVASSVQSFLPFPIYAFSDSSILSEKVDLATTLGGDGTILHASALFSKTPNVPPVLSFSMGTLGFLGEWKFEEFKRAFREVYMSGAGAGSHLFQDQQHPYIQELAGIETGVVTGWSSIRGKSMGTSRLSKVLLRSRLKVGVFDANGQKLNDIGNGNGAVESETNDIHAMNEVIIHRGANPHMAIIEIFVGGRFLTEAVADGMIIATPTGSTAYSLSSGGSIIHPLVSSLLMTPICPRSLSFRPLVLPANTPLTLRLSEKNRGRGLEVSIDGQRNSRGVACGMELRVVGEDIKSLDGSWSGGVPCIMRGTKSGMKHDDGWVGGLNGLLKFNHPFGEE